MRVLLFSICLILSAGCSDGGRDQTSDASPTNDTGPDTQGSGSQDGGPSWPDVPPSCDFPADSDDFDGDGFTPATGDCDDCQAQINPGAYDFPDNDVDEDCQDGDALSVDFHCDEDLMLASEDATDAARSMGLCRFTDDDSDAWGILSARYTTAAGERGLDSPTQTGLLPSFGVNEPREAMSMLALSSGVARAPNHEAYTPECDLFWVDTGFIDVLPVQSAYPPGFPMASESCPSVEAGPVFNAAALELQIRVPTNARSFSFETNFFTYEYPQYICSEYNDFFVTLVDPAPAGAVAGNVVFDTDGNLVSVNNSFLQVCEAGTHGGKTFGCPRGPDELSGTGFDGTAQCGTGFIGLEPEDVNPGQANRAATGWLLTTVPVEGGSVITVRFAIWDSGDPEFDSLVLIDNFQWSVEEGEVRTIPVLI